MRLCKIRYVVLTVLCCIAVSRQAAAKSSGGMAFDLNERAISYALEVSGRHSDERAKAVNTLARIAFMRMDFTRSWELYSSVPAITRNMLEVVASEIGLMRICQRTSDNVSFYEYRNRILLDLRALHEEQETLPRLNACCHWNGRSGWNRHDTGLSWSSWVWQGMRCLMWLPIIFCVTTMTGTLHILICGASVSGWILMAARSCCPKGCAALTTVCVVQSDTIM